MSSYIPQQKRIYAHCDGASRGNPGPAAVGIHIKGEDKKTVLKEVYECIGSATNNVAEYKAVITALKTASELTNKEVHIMTDSDLVVKQLTKIWRVKKPHLQELVLEVKKLEALYESVVYIQVPRNANTTADALANKALDEVGS